MRRSAIRLPTTKVWPLATVQVRTPMGKYGLVMSLSALLRTTDGPWLVDDTNVFCCRRVAGGVISVGPAPYLRKTTSLVRTTKEPFTPYRPAVSGIALRKPLVSSGRAETRSIVA